MPLINFGFMFSKNKDVLLKISLGPKLSFKWFLKKSAHLFGYLERKPNLKKQGIVIINGANSTLKPLI